MAREAGVADAVVDAIAAREEPAFTDANEAAVHRFAKELCETHQVSDPTYAALRDKLGDRQVVELTMVIGYYNYVSAMLNTFEVRLPSGVTPLAS